MDLSYKTRVSCADLPHLGWVVLKTNTDGAPAARQSAAVTMVEGFLRLWWQ